MPPLRPAGVEIGTIPLINFSAKRMRLCYSVRVTNTSEHISVRLPAQLVAELRAEAEAEDRSLAWVIARRLAGSARVAQLAERRAKSAEDAGSIPAAGKLPVSSSKSCSQCGALNGLHQKGCKQK